jgi:3-oxoacyl-[acyl-carrier-protein] synthase II
VSAAVITGLGAVSALGPSLRATREALERGERAPGPLAWAAPFSCDQGAEATGFDPRAHFRQTKALKLTDRRTRLAVAAALAAAEDGSWPLDDERATEELGVVIGTSGSDLGARELSMAVAGDADGLAARDCSEFGRRILAGLRPIWLLVNLPNMSSAHVAIQLGARGPNSTVMTDWSAGLQALGEAAAQVGDGSASALLAGGADCAMHPFAYASCEQAGVLGPGGVTPAEGAAVFLVEPEGRALARGARVRAHVRGFGTSVDGAASCMRAALDEAGWSPADVDVVCGAADEDMTSVFGERWPRRLDLRPALGHAFAASAPLELACLVDRGAGRVLAASTGICGHSAALALETVGEAGA